jgi:hypothetical protein
MDGGNARGVQRSSCGRNVGLLIGCVDLGVAERAALGVTGINAIL